MQCVRDCVESVYANFAGYRMSRGGNDPLLGQEIVMDELDTRLVRLELQDRRCLNEARRHRVSGSKALFRSKMLERRRLQEQMAQLHRFKENAMAQFDALSNHELNRTFIKAMQGVVGASKSRVAASREDAENVMGDLQESMTQVKDLSDILGQPVMGGGALMSDGDEVTDDELESEFMQVTDGSELQGDCLTSEIDLLQENRAGRSDVAQTSTIPPSSAAHLAHTVSRDQARAATVRQAQEPVLVLPPSLSGAS